MANNSGVKNAELVRQACVGKTPEQKEVIRYFLRELDCVSSLFEKVMSDDEYMAAVMAKRDSLKLKERALGKIGVDIDQVSEITPVKFEGFVFKNAYAKRRANGNWVSSAYQISWLFFSSSQIYVSVYTFHMDEDKKTERTDEFFYKDITAFSTSSETETANTLGDKKIEVTTNKFAMVVPGEKLFISMEGVPDAEATIQAMKHKLREKKV